MALNINGTKLKKCNVNGVKCKRINVNGVKVWSAEETIFKALSFETEATSTSGSSTREKYSSTYPIDFSQWETLTITGIAGGKKTDNGTYNRYTYVILQYSIDDGSSWVDFLPRLHEAYQMSSDYTNVNRSYDVSALTATNGLLRVYLYCKNSGDEYTSTSGTAYCENLTCVAE